MAVTLYKNEQGSKIAVGTGTPVHTGVAGDEYKDLSSGLKYIYSSGAWTALSTGTPTTYTSSNGITLTGSNFTLDNTYFSGAFTLSAGVATIGASYVTNGMLAGSIAASKLVGTDIVTVGTIGAGTWQGTAIADTYIASAATWNGKASLASPAFTGTPTAPTATPLTNNTQVATTAYVDAAVTAGGSSGTFNYGLANALSIGNFMM